MLKWGLAATLVIATLAGQTSPERQEPSDAVDAYVARQMSRYRIPVSSYGSYHPVNPHPDLHLLSGQERRGKQTHHEKTEKQK